MASDREEYFEKVFGGVLPDKERIKAALEKAHEIRQFEIRLYWQRSLFFWGFLVVLLGGLGLVVTAEEQTALTKLASIAIAALGMFVNCAWYYIAKGSKAWQKNWELHIDYLEDCITGSLHKTILATDDSSQFLSVSRITQSVIKAFGFFWALALPAVTMNFFYEEGLETFICWASGFFEKCPGVSLGLAIIISLALPIIVMFKVCGLKRKVWPTSGDSLPDKSKLKCGIEVVGGQRKMKDPYFEEKDCCCTCGAFLKKFAKKLEEFAKDLEKSAKKS